jgi:hypothetical protein
LASAANIATNVATGPSVNRKGSDPWRFDGHIGSRSDAHPANRQRNNRSESQSKIANHKILRRD